MSNTTACFSCNLTLLSAMSKSRLITYQVFSSPSICSEVIFSQEGITVEYTR